MNLEAHNIEALARQLAQDLEPAIQAGAMGIGAALQDVIAPYPPPPATSVYRRTGQDQQGWRIRQVPMGAVLENRVAHSIYLHGSLRERPGQTRVHERAGWTNEDTAIKRVVEGGQANDIMERALAERLEIMG